MPIQVDSVPNVYADAWAPYMDGSIWKFTDVELNAMPKWNPTLNKDKEIVSMRMYQWNVVIDGVQYYYIIFVDYKDKRSIEELAGWFK